MIQISRKEVDDNIFLFLLQLGSRPARTGFVRSMNFLLRVQKVVSSISIL